MSQLHLHSKLPKYVRLAEQMRQHILSGDLKTGDRLPSFAEMRALHGVSQSILERAYALLEEDNLIERRPGLGTFVALPVERPGKNVLGLILHIDPQGMAVPYNIQWLGGVKNEAAKYDLQIHWINPQDEENISRENVDAVLMYCDPTEALAINLPANLPHVMLFQHSPDFNCVSADDYNGAKLAVQYLLSLGHQRICYLASTKLDSVSRQRVAGYEAALKEAGIQQEQDWLKFLTRHHRIGYLEAGEMTMRHWLQDNWEQLGCTAIVVHNDEAAIGVMKAISHYGLQIPKDVSVIGFDGAKPSDLCSPSLTTIKVPLEAIGKRAVKVLLQQINEGVIESGQSVLPVQLKIGKSTAPLKLRTRGTAVHLTSKE